MLYTKKRVTDNLVRKPDSRAIISKDRSKSYWNEEDGNCTKVESSCLANSVRNTAILMFLFDIVKL